MSDEPEKTNWLSQALEIDHAREALIKTIDWAKPTKMLEITPNREVVFFGPDGAETWRCSFDDLSAALRQLLDANGPYPPPNWPVEPKTKRDEPRARKVGER